MIQVGARNMQNYGLLEVVGKLGKPVLLKRGLSSTLDELLQAADYVLKEGNERVILCERGIRTFDTAMRFTLDLGAVPWLKLHTHLPVIVDPSATPRATAGSWGRCRARRRPSAPTGSSSRSPRIPRPRCATGPQQLYARDFAEFAGEVAAHAGLVGRTRPGREPRVPVSRYPPVCELTPPPPPGPAVTPRAVQTARWLVRPSAMMEELHRRYGDMFTLQIANEGTWVFLAHPDAVKQVFTGDPRLLHAGEANRVLLPLLGHHSVLLLDDAAHMRQRKLMLPPFHGERMRGYAAGDGRGRASGDRALAARASRYAVRPAMQRITLEMIMRTVFGVQDERRRERLMAILGRRARVGRRPASGWPCWPSLGPAAHRQLAHVPQRARPGRRADLRGDPRAPRRAPTSTSATTCCRCCSQARHEDGSPMTDEELRDELMTLLVAGHETTASSLAWAVERLVRHPEALERLREEADAGGSDYADAVVQGDAAAAPDPVARGAPAQGADGDRRPPAARGRDRGALHLPGAPPARHLPRSARVPARALPRAAGRHLHLDPVRRRRAPLPGSELRAVRDAHRAAGARRAGSTCAPPTRARSASCAGRSPSCRAAAARSWPSGAPSVRRCAVRGRRVSEPLSRARSARPTPARG